MTMLSSVPQPPRPLRERCPPAPTGTSQNPPEPLPRAAVRFHPKQPFCLVVFVEGSQILFRPFFQADSYLFDKAFCQRDSYPLFNRFV